MFRSKRGFTLVELTVVIAVTAVVITMICTFMLAFGQHAVRIEKNSDAMSDINTCRAAVNEWISAYDSKAYNMTASGRALSVGVDDTLEYGDRGLVWNRTGSEYKCYPLSVMTGCTFEMKNGMVYCKTVCNGETVDFVCNVFSETQRDRYSTADRIHDERGTE